MKTINIKLDLSRLYRCPACGYYDFNGLECYACGFTYIRSN